MPLNANIGGQTKYIKDKDTLCLTEDQVRHVYKKVETGKVINIDTIKQEIEQDVDRIDDMSGKINPYHEIIVNKVGRDNMILSQIEQWSILSNVVNYVQYGKHQRNFHNLDIKAIDQKNHKRINKKVEEDR